MICYQDMSFTASPSLLLWNFWIRHTKGWLTSPTYMVTSLNASSLLMPEAYNTRTRRGIFPTLCILLIDQNFSYSSLLGFYSVIKNLSIWLPLTLYQNAYVQIVGLILCFYIKSNQKIQHASPVNNKVYKFVKGLLCSLCDIFRMSTK